MRNTDKIKKRLVVFDNGEQVLLESDNQSGLTINVSIDDATPVTEVELDIEDNEYEELRKKARTNAIDLDTISDKMKIKNPDKKDRKLDK